PPPPPPSRWGLRKVPRVSLERLDLDLELSGASQPPVFRVFPGSSAPGFSLIVIERGGGGGTQPLPRLLPHIKVGVASPPPIFIPPPPFDPPHPHPQQEEQQQQQEDEDEPGPSGSPDDTKPLDLIPSELPGPPQYPPDPAAPPGPFPEASCCRVCGRAGAVVMCDRCQRCFHLQCHLPPLHEVPSPEWRCLLCQELPPGDEDAQEGSPQGLSRLEQQKCEYVLLQLLCHEPCRPLHRL
ncbi:TIF1B factor, partial [Urocolius indicus]|nr:TIF1B factor [Urocolius indicus]